MEIPSVFLFLIPLSFLLLFYLSFHNFGCWNCGIREDVGASAFVVFKLGFDPSLPCRELPSGRVPSSCVYSEHFDKVLSVSDKNLPL